MQDLRQEPGEMVGEADQINQHHKEEPIQHHGKPEGPHPGEHITQHRKVGPLEKTAGHISRCQDQKAPAEPAPEVAVGRNRLH
ncbi:hypothetical protein DSECCO2_624170 [anaerobic digester metagenome]